MASSFTIDKVAWHTQTQGNTETREQVHARFRSVIDFLQENALTVRPIAPDLAVDDDTAITTNDLTAEGIEIMKQCYDQWLGKVDHGMPSDDMTLFKDALERRRM